MPCVCACVCVCVYDHAYGHVTSQVGFVEQQVQFSRVHRTYSPPTDPRWSQQWSLVSWQGIYCLDSSNIMSTPPRVVLMSAL